MSETDYQRAVRQIRERSPSLAEPPKHNHTRWRNNDEPWSPCPDTCPVQFADVLAERDRLRAVVQRVEGLAAELDLEMDEAPILHREWSSGEIARLIRDTLSGPSPSIDAADTQTGGPAPATAQDAIQGAGDGV